MMDLALHWTRCLTSTLVPRVSGIPESAILPPGVGALGSADDLIPVSTGDRHTTGNTRGTTAALSNGATAREV